MTVTVQDVMRQMRNYFIASTLTGTFTVADGIIDLDPPLAPGAWVAIEGSGSLDGVHQLDENGKLPDAADGSWRGLLHLLSPTADFLRLCAAVSHLFFQNLNLTIPSQQIAVVSERTTGHGTTGT